MLQNALLPKEGDLYKCYVIDKHTFEIRYGYYEERERGLVEPLPIFPDLVSKPVFTEDGEPITSRVQIPCEHYRPRNRRKPEGWCADCIHYKKKRDEMGLCKCPIRKRE